MFVIKIKVGAISFCQVVVQQQEAEAAIPLYVVQPLLHPRHLLGGHEVKCHLQSLREHQLGELLEEAVKHQLVGVEVLLTVTLGCGEGKVCYITVNLKGGAPFLAGVKGAVELIDRDINVIVGK